MNGIRGTLASLFLATGLVGVCSAQNLTATDDTWVDGNRPTRVAGTGSEPLYVHNWGPKRVFVRFDPAGLGSSVEQATLALHLTELWANGPIDVYAVTEDWSEATVSFNNAPTTEAVPFASFTVTTSRIGTYATVDVTSVVTRWIDGSLPAEGFMLATRDPIRAVFASKENGRPPVLALEEEGGGDGQPTILDFTTDLPVVIDEPGEYALDRNWALEDRAGFGGTVLRIEARDVTVDFEGYYLSATHTGGSLVEVIGDVVTLRNGRLLGDLYIVPVNSQAGATHIEGMRIHAEQPIRLQGDGARFADSEVVAKAGVTMGGSALVERSRFMHCEGSCLRVTGENAEIRGNEFAMDMTFIGDAVVIDGNDAVFSENLIDQRFAEGTRSSLVVNGANNRVLDNTFLLGRSMNALISINGTANTVDNNIAAPRADGATPSQGLVFTVAGNFYGDNRLRATVPYNLNGTSQTDWGGNVGY